MSSYDTWAVAKPHDKEIVIWRKLTPSKIRIFPTASLEGLLTAGAGQKSEVVWDGLGKDTASVIPIFFFYYPLGRILLSKWAWLD